MNNKTNVEKAMPSKGDGSAKELLKLASETPDEEAKLKSYQHSKNFLNG